MYLPTYSPHQRCFLNPIEMLWRHFRREVTHCEFFESVEKLVEASERFFERLKENARHVLSIIGSNVLSAPHSA